MRALFTILVMLVVVADASAQTDASDAERAPITAAVQKFFDTMASKDVAAARAVLIPEGRLIRVRTPSGEVSTTTIKEYLDRLPASKQQQRERFWNPEIRVQDG